VAAWPACHGLIQINERPAEGDILEGNILPVGRSGEELSCKRGAVMVVENTDLERRVLAHEQILQVLIAHLAEAEPKFLERLQHIFSHHRVMGAEEQDYTDTSQYAEQFIQQVMRLRKKVKGPL
jgi:hypothetical protein